LHAGLTVVTEDVVIVAGRWAYPTYLGLRAYICQPNRKSRPVNRIGFYLDKAVMPELPKIERVFHAMPATIEAAAECELSDDPDEQRLSELIRWRIADSTWEAANDFYLLSAPRDRATVRLQDPIPHRGKGPWIRGQRYVKVQDLLIARATSDLDQRSPPRP
jgi:hypothetical protein